MSATRSTTSGILVPTLLRASATDEFAPRALTDRDERVLSRTAVYRERLERHAAVDRMVALHDRRTTAALLRSINEECGEVFFDVPEAAVYDLDVADATFEGGSPVIDVQTHLVDAQRFAGPSGRPLAAFLRSVDPQRWSEPIHSEHLDAAAWASLVFGASETAIAVLTSTPGVAAHNVLRNEQIAAVRTVTERYAGSGRLLTHTIVHPNVDGELDAMHGYRDTLRPDGWKVYTLYGPPTEASPTGGWFLDDPAVGVPFLERVRELGPRIVATHKGLGGPVSSVTAPAASPRDIGPAAALFPDVTFLVYHSGYETDSGSPEGAYDSIAAQGVDRLIASVTAAGIGPHGNVYAELGSTWFLVLRRPQEAAHVVGKLLAALGESRVLWGTDSVWYGSPQPLVDAFRAFVIPETFQERYGYPALTRDMKERILSRNAVDAYGIDESVLFRVAADRDRTWIADAARSFLAAVDEAR